VDSITREEFEDLLREGLGHMHDPYRLRRSQLAALFGVANRHDTPGALRRILTEAIEALEPSDGTPDESRGWRMYESMTYRYVEQFAQEAVAEQMGLSSRQVRREQRAALEAMAYHLWNRFGLGALGPAESTHEPPPAAQVITQELAWLQESPPGVTTDLAEALPGILRLVQPLAASHQVAVSLDPGWCSAEVAIDPIALRQILLNLLSLAVAITAPSGRVWLAVEIAAQHIHLRVQAEGGDSPASARSKVEDEATIALAEQVATLCGARLSVQVDPFDAVLVVAGSAQTPVLVVDDNLGTLQLIQRYLQGTRYRPVEVQYPDETVSLATTLLPALIILDVMMPRVDGWEILGRLREHPGTREIPVVICTILAQKDLALALGAADFLAKPFSRQSLLDVLDRQLTQAAES
jgi:CheY-like chemotaxis protein